MSVLQFVFTNPATSEYSASRHTIKDHFRARALAISPPVSSKRIRKGARIVSSAKPLVGWQKKLAVVDEDCAEDEQFSELLMTETESTHKHRRNEARLQKLPPGFEGWDTSSKQLIRYVTTVWMPSKDSIPLGCHLAGYSPICMNDDLIGDRLVTRAIQLGGFPFYALLAVASSRMKIATPANQNLITVPEHFMMKAIQSLRKDIAAKSVPSSDDLVLGLAFISLAAVFAGQHHETVCMYGSMMKRMVDSMGGFESLSNFTAFFVVISDFLAASVVVTTTSLTFEDNHRIHIEDSNSVSAVQDSRFGNAVSAHGMISEILLAFHSLPADVLSLIRTYIRGNSRQYYKTATSALQLCWIGQRPANEWHNNPQLLQADLLLSNTRYLALGLWLRSIAISIGGKASVREYELFSKHRMKKDACRMMSSLKEVKALLMVTDWKVPKDLSEWMTELYGKLVPSSAENFSYAHAARMERVKRSRCLPLEKVVPA